MYSGQITPINYLSVPPSKLAIRLYASTTRERISYHSPHTFCWFVGPDYVVEIACTAHARTRLARASSATRSSLAPSTLSLLAIPRLPIPRRLSRLRRGELHPIRRLHRRHATAARRVVEHRPPVADHPGRRGLPFARSPIPRWDRVRTRPKANLGLSCLGFPSRSSSRSFGAYWRYHQAIPRATSSPLSTGRRGGWRPRPPCGRIDQWSPDESLQDFPNASSDVACFDRVPKSWPVSGASMPCRRILTVVLSASQNAL